MSTKPKLTTGEEANRFIEKVREKYLSKGDVFPLQDKTVTENGEVKADSEYYGLNKVTVNVEPEPLVLEPTTVISTGTEKIINPPSGVAGFSRVTVNPIDLENKTITENGVYTSETKSGFGEVTVNVQLEEPDLAYTYRNKSVITAEDLAGLTEIPDSMFRGDTNLVSIDIPEGVTTISEKAFSGCAYLCHVGLPSTLTKIKKEAFYNCSSLYKLDIPNNCNVDASNIIGGTKIREFTITSNITKYNPMHNCATLETITIAEGVTSISNIADSYSPYYVFNFNFPSTLTTIGSGCFEMFTCLTELTFPDNLTTIANNAIMNCVNLRSISLPDGITSFGTFAITGSNSKLRTIYVRGNSSCTTATTLGNLTAAQLNNATVVYLENE